MSRDRTKKRDSIYLGTSSFSETDWVGPFYPKGAKPAEFLSLYARKYETVEIDATYYAIPAARTVDGWAAKTPDSFIIAAKFPRSIVHGGDSSRPDPKVVLMPDTTYDARDRFLDVMSRLGTRLGPLVLQFPYFSKAVFDSKEEFYDRLDRFLTDLPDGFRYAVEIRNRAWLKPEYVDMLRRHNAALTLVDQAWMPHGDEMIDLFDPVTSDFVYIRLLGDRKEIEAITESWDKEVIDHGERLQRWADLTAKLIERDIEIFIYVNNHYAGHAPATCDRLNDMLIERLK